MSNNTTILHPESHHTPTCELQFKEVVLLTLYILVMFLGVVGNFCIFYVFCFRNKQRKTVTELLILYLAAFDFLASIFGPFIFMYWIVTCNREWAFGYFGCKLLPLLSRLFINISVGVILILAIDRYRAICSPFRGQIHRNYIHLAVMITIILSIASEYFYIEALTLSPPLNVCLVIPSDKSAYSKGTLAMLLIRDLIFVIAFTLTTTLIAITIRKRDLYFTSGNNNMNTKETGRVVRVIIVMELVFLILVLPRDLLHISFSFSWLDGDGIPYTMHIVNINEFLKVFQTANCCANIFIYAKLHDRFRSTVIEVFHSSIGFGSTMSKPAALIRYKRQLMPTKKNVEKPYERKLLKRPQEQKKYTRKLLKSKECEASVNRNTEMYIITYDTDTATSSTHDNTPDISPDTTPETTPETTPTVSDLPPDYSTVFALLGNVKDISDTSMII